MIIYIVIIVIIIIMLESQPTYFVSYGGSFIAVPTVIKWGHFVFHATFMLESSSPLTKKGKFFLWCIGSLKAIKECKDILYPANVARALLHLTAYVY